MKKALFTNLNLLLELLILITRNHVNSNRVYFRKETFSSKKQIQSYLEFIVMKTIASFLNTRGGKLVIGVHEYAKIKKKLGIDRGLPR